MMLYNHYDFTSEERSPWSESFQERLTFVVCIWCSTSTATPSGEKSPFEQTWRFICRMLISPLSFSTLEWCMLIWQEGLHYVFLSCESSNIFLYIAVPKILTLLCFSLSEIPVSNSLLSVGGRCYKSPISWCAVATRIGKIRSLTLKSFQI